MTVSRVNIIENTFVEFVRQWTPVNHDPPKNPVDLPGDAWIGMFQSQVISRLLDYEARRLKELNQGYYTIGSAGHEGNVVLGYLLGRDDPCFLHYRSGAFMVEHLKQCPGLDAVETILLSLCASSDDPVSGGRHKVWGSQALWIPPQTSTIASHLPKAVGTAFAIERAKRLNLSLPFSRDAIVMCSFGDASINHSTAQGAINSALWASYQRLPVPVLFVCEDNGIGISVKTPRDWVEATMKSKPGMVYLKTNGLDLEEAFRVSKQAIQICREKRQPVFLHLKTTRLMGHAGSDVESEYLSKEEIEACEAKDPLLASAAFLLENRWLNPKELLDFYGEQKSAIREKSEKIVARPKLMTASEVMAPLAPYRAEVVQAEAVRGNSAIRDLRLPGSEKPRHMAMLINFALYDLMHKYPEMLVFGEDVAKKGGVYHVTTGLQERYGSGRVFNTLLDEQTILGMAIGAAQVGFLPVPEIQYLAYVHNAEDQIRGEAASLQYFSKDQFRNPMMIRMASFAYQKGFGGHFHNDNALGALRDIPGLVLAAPSRGDDAVKMMRTLMALGKMDGRVSVFLEPIALYMTKDLYQEGDGLWSAEYPAADAAIPLGEPGVYHPEHEDLLLISYANGLYFSLRVARELLKHGIRAKVIDVRWLNPLPLEKLLRESEGFERILIVDECRRTGGGISHAVESLLYGRLGGQAKIHSINAEDTFIPLGPAANLVLPTEKAILEKALNLTRGPSC